MKILIHTRGRTNPPINGACIAGGPTNGGEFRLIHGRSMCPYDGCSGSTLIHGWDWGQFQEQSPQYPKIPELGVRYELYPKDFPVLTGDARRILAYLVMEIRKGRFDPENERTFCRPKEIREALGSHLIPAPWSAGPESQGLIHLHKWTRTHQLPAIAGLVPGDKRPRRPEACFYKEYGLPDDSVDWWREQVKAAIRFDWSQMMNA